MATTGKTISRHMLRRTARKKEKQLELAIRMGPATNPLLSEHGLQLDDRLKVEPSMRGPFGWRIVTW